MRKYTFKYKEDDGKEIEQSVELDLDLDRIAVVVDQFEHRKEGEKVVDEEALEKMYGKIYSHSSTICDKRDSNVKKVTYYYIPAIAEDRKVYKTIDSFDNEYEFEGMVEIKFQYGEDYCFAYVDVKSKNCSTFDIVEFALDKIYDNPSKYILGASKVEHDNTIVLPLMNEGGWENPFEVYDWEEESKSFISGFRFVEEVKNRD